MVRGRQPSPSYARARVETGKAGENGQSAPVVSKDPAARDRRFDTRLKTKCGTIAVAQFLEHRTHTAVGPGENPGGNKWRGTKSGVRGRIAIDWVTSRSHVPNAPRRKAACGCSRSANGTPRRGGRAVHRLRPTCPWWKSIPVVAQVRARGPCAAEDPGLTPGDKGRLHQRRTPGTSTPPISLGRVDLY